MSAANKALAIVKAAQAVALGQAILFVTGTQRKRLIVAATISEEAQVPFVQRKTPGRT